MPDKHDIVRLDGAGIADTELQERLQEAWSAALREPGARGEIAAVLGVEARRLPDEVPLHVGQAASNLGGVLEGILVVYLVAAAHGFAEALGENSGKEAGQALWTYLAGRIRARRPSAVPPELPPEG